LGKFLDKSKKTGSRVEPAVATALLAGSLAVTGGVAALNGGTTENLGQRTQNTIQSIEKVAQEENAAQTLAALEDEKIKETSETIKGRTIKGWGIGVNLAGAVTTGVAVSQVRRRKKKLEAEESWQRN
jgi:hypothetical protein